MKISIRVKFAITLFVVSLMTFGVTLLYALKALNVLGGESIGYGKGIAMCSVGRCRSALVERSRQEVKNDARDFALIVKARLNRVTGSLQKLMYIYPYLPEPAVLPSDVIVMKPGETPRAEENTFSFLIPSSAVPGSRGIRNSARHFSRLRTVLPMIINSDSLIHTVFAADADGCLFCYPFNTFDRSYNFLKRSWYLSSRAYPEEFCWTGAYKSGAMNIREARESSIITCSRGLFGSHKEYLGIIGINIRLKELTSEILVKPDEADKENMIFLLDSDGFLITGNSRFLAEFPALSLDKNKDSELKKLSKEMRDGKFGVLDLEFREKKYCVGYAPVGEFGMSVGVIRHWQTIVKPAEMLERELLNAENGAKVLFRNMIAYYQRHFFLLLIVLLVLVFSIALVAGYRMSLPISELLSNAKRISGGDLNFRSNLHTGDELEDVSNSLNNMSSELKAYITNLNMAAVQKQKMASELRAAAQIQSSMLRKDFPPFPERRDIDLYARMNPARDIGGDLYDFVLTRKNRLFFSIGDVSGKGIPAAIFMATAKTIMRTIALGGHSPEEILTHANNYLEDGNTSCMFLTAFCGILDCVSGKVVCCSGGHNPPVLLKKTGSASFLDLPKGIPLGPFVSAENEYFRQAEIPLEEGDTLCLYTDGVTEAENEAKEQFGNSRLLAELEKCYKEEPEMIPEKIVGRIRKAVSDFAGKAEQSDDITILCLTWYGKSRMKKKGNFFHTTNKPNKPNNPKFTENQGEKENAGV